MERAEEKAREYEDSLDYYHYTSDNPSVAYKAGYEQALSDIKDLINSNVAVGYASNIIRLIEHASEIIRLIEQNYEEESRTICTKALTPWSEDGMSRKDKTDLIEACIKGYEQAEKDLALTWEEAKKIVAAFFYVVETELIGPVLMEDEELYGKVLKRFNEQRKK